MSQSDESTSAMTHNAGGPTRDLPIWQSGQKIDNLRSDIEKLLAELPEDVESIVVLAGSYVDGERSESEHIGWLNVRANVVQSEISQSMLAHRVSLLGDEINLNILRSILCRPKTLIDLDLELGVGSRVMYTHMTQLKAADLVHRVCGCYRCTAAGVRAYMTIVSLMLD